MSYIKREDAKNAIMAYIGEQTVSKYATAEECRAARHGAEGAFNELDYLPTADVVEVRYGKWEVHGTHKKENILMIGLICSECHFSIAKKVNLDDEKTMIDNYLYCPECGAKMDGGTRDIDAFIEQIKSCSYTVIKDAGDVVEVVRCKDCAHYHGMEDFEYKGRKARHCVWHSVLRDEDDYCSDGMRRNGRREENEK